MIEDSYLTVAGVASAKFVDRKSIFLAFVHFIQDVSEAEAILKDYRKKYYDARHVCYSYVLNGDDVFSKSSDNGEPSGTAGRPILGEILTRNLRNVIVIVVRYFGGIKLGTPGLIAAYKQSASNVLENAEIITKSQEEIIRLSFPYDKMNDVMTLVKSLEAKVVESSYEIQCELSIIAPKSVIRRISNQLKDYVKK